MLFHLGQKTELEKAYIEAVGRALCIAQNFEVNCRTLENVLSIEGSENEIEFENLIKELPKRMLGRAINELGKYYGGLDEVTVMLEAAKDARNHIAHDSMKSLFERSKIEEQLTVDLVELRKVVRKITDADVIVSELFCLVVSEDQCITKASYSTDAVDWVFSDFRQKISKIRNKTTLTSLQLPY